MYWNTFKQDIYSTAGGEEGGGDVGLVRYEPDHKHKGFKL